MTRTVLTVNGGSSSLKCALFEQTADGPRAVFRRSESNASRSIDELLLCLKHLLDDLSDEADLSRIAAVGHRVVHGGQQFEHPEWIDAERLAALKDLAPLAPLHQPAGLALIEACIEALPGVSQLACFDTAFHRTLPFHAKHYALPGRLRDAGIQAYGFHGLSYEYIWDELAARDDDAIHRKIVVAHLGAGASLCAVRGGRSIATTMGFSTADGVPMATRSGSLDPGILIYLMRERRMGADDLERLIYEQSGLIGLSGESGDMLKLRASSNPQAREAIEFFVYRVARAVGSLAVALGGIDTLVFTGGIGANDAKLRDAVVDQTKWLSPDLEVLAIPTDEEAMIARHALARLDTR